MEKNNLEKLNSKNYAKYDRAFMLAGSFLNGAQGYIAKLKSKKEVKEVLNMLWKMAKEDVSDYVDELYDNQDEIPQINDELPL